MHSGILLLNLVYKLQIDSYEENDIEIRIVLLVILDILYF